VTFAFGSAMENGLPPGRPFFLRAPPSAATEERGECAALFVK
jgi:hypothetical protein